MDHTEGRETKVAFYRQQFIFNKNFFGNDNKDPVCLRDDEDEWNESMINHLLID